MTMSFSLPHGPYKKHAPLGYCGASFSLRGALAPPVLPVSCRAAMGAQMRLRGALAPPVLPVGDCAAMSSHSNLRAALAPFLSNYGGIESHSNRDNSHGGAEAPRKLKLAPQWFIGAGI